MFTTEGLNKIQLALGITPEKIEKNIEEINDYEEKLFYCWSSGREGMHVITNNKGDLLLAVGSYPKEKILEAYLQGQRTEFSENI